MFNLYTIFAVYFITLIITKSKLFENVRNYFEDRENLNKFFWFFKNITTCFMCCSVWVSTIVVFSFLNFNYPFTLLYIFANAGLAYISHITLFSIESIGDFFYEKSYMYAPKSKKKFTSNPQPIPTKQMSSQPEDSDYYTRNIKFFSPSNTYEGRMDIIIRDYARDDEEDVETSFGVAYGNFSCRHNNLTSLDKMPIEVYGNFNCSFNKLKNLDNMPKFIGGKLICWYNPFENLNGLKNVEIKNTINFEIINEKELDYWIKALTNTDLDALEWHYDNHKYEIHDLDGIVNQNFESYLNKELEEIIKIKRIQRDLNV